MEQRRTLPKKPREKGCPWVWGDQRSPMHGAAVLGDLHLISRPCKSHPESPFWEAAESGKELTFPYSQSKCSGQLRPERMASAEFCKVVKFLSDRSFRRHGFSLSQLHLLTGTGSHDKNSRPSSFTSTSPGNYFLRTFSFTSTHYLIDRKKRDGPL